MLSWKSVWHRNNRRCSKQLLIAEEARSIAEKGSEERKHEVGGWDREGCEESAAEIDDREEQIAHTTKKVGQRAAGVVREGWELISRRSVMRSSLSRTGTSSHRPEGLQQPKAISNGRSRDHPVWASRSWTGRREATDSIANQERHESCEAERCIQEHTAQRSVVAVEEQPKFVKKSLEIQVEEKQVAEIKNKVQTVNKSFEVANSRIKQTQMTSVNCHRCHECQNRAHAETKSSESKRTSRLVRNPEDQEKSETPRRERDEQGEDRDHARFGEVMVYSAKHPHEGKAQGQVYVEGHHEEVQGRESRGQRNFEWDTDLVETKKLEKYTSQVAQDLYSGEAQHELRGEQHCRSLHENVGRIENAVARKETWTSNPGWYEGWRQTVFEQLLGSSRGARSLSSHIWQNVHDNTPLRPRPRQHDFNPWQQGSSVGPGQYPRYTDARKGRPWVAQMHHKRLQAANKTHTLTRRRSTIVITHMETEHVRWTLAW